MEDLAQSWKKLSLTDEEKTNVDLSSDKRNKGSVLAAKFFTRRSLNIEAVARTFRPLWQTRSSFEVSDAGNNVLLIAFELEVDAEKVLHGEPWAFDRHLVVFQKYDGSTPIQELRFTTTNFWVQLHNLPYSLLTTEAALSLGKTIGVVTKPKDVSEMRGGNFMRVRVAVDITKPLCRGRWVTWDQTEKGWVSFLYERLPNICYWCGHLSHDDKDCVLWLSSKGTLTADDQQFGPWIRAPQFNPVRRSVIAVQGFEHPGRQGKGVSANTGTTQGGSEAGRDGMTQLRTVDLTESPVSSHMETDERCSGAVNGREKTVDGGVLS
ncbi:uncharacterized protein LOC112000407 [Quercus suber]|uniref:uncharacterized protein LOC112000407 n=1 Tax=Quercus suber TaxID=58331 RepID=UPI000CE20B72|nr:uncharacterized protein LOC112000407 [Quercus suber]